MYPARLKDQKAVYLQARLLYAPRELVPKTPPYISMRGNGGRRGGGSVTQVKASCRFRSPRAGLHGGGGEDTRRAERPLCFGSFIGVVGFGFYYFSLVFQFELYCLSLVFHFGFYHFSLVFLLNCVVFHWSSFYIVLSFILKYIVITGLPF